MPRRPFLLLLIPLLVWTVAITAALYPYLPLTFPWVQDQPPLSLVRMQTDLNVLAGSDRSPGTATHTAARVYLAQKLKDLGFEIEVQSFKANGVSAPLENIVARLPGKNGADAALLIAHYDSVSGSPGASDDASGVAAVLEIARGVLTVPREKNDLVILFTDGEEIGILGARAFAEHHPLAKKVRVALNLDGVSVGPVMLWQTSPQNGWLVSEYLSAAPHPMGASWADGLIRLLPIDFDLHYTNDAGITGGTFSSPYLPMTSHTALDKIDGVAPASLESAQSQGLALIRALLDADLSNPKAPDDNFFTLWGPLMVVYPLSASLYAGIVAFILLGAAAFFVFRASPVPLKASALVFGRALLFCLASLAFAALAQLLIETVVFYSYPQLSPFIVMASSAALLLLLLWIAYARVRRSLPARMLLLAAQFLLAVFTLATSIVQPLFSPPLTLLLLLSLIPWIFVFVPAISDPGGPIARLASAALMLFIGAPVVYLLYLVSGALFIPAIIAAALWALMLALLLPISAPSGLE